MPYTAEQKRELRAKQALAKGKTYKSHFLKAQERLPTTPKVLPISPPPQVLSMEEEMNRARMGEEDSRARMVQMMSDSNTLRTHYKNWLHVGQIVDIKPLCKNIIGIPANENYIRYKLVSRNNQGLWITTATKGPNTGKRLWIDLPEEFLC